MANNNEFEPCKYRSLETTETLQLSSARRVARIKPLDGDACFRSIQSHTGGSFRLAFKRMTLTMFSYYPLPSTFLVLLSALKSGEIVLAEEYQHLHMTSVVDAAVKSIHSLPLISTAWNEIKPTLHPIKYT